MTVTRTLLASLLLVAFVMVGLAPPSLRAQQPAFVDVLLRLGRYLDRYEQSLASVIADETYEQRYESRSPRRRLATVKQVTEADFLFLRLPEDAHWLGVRSVRRIDGKPLTGGDEPLAARLARGPGSANEEARQIADENARHNLGEIPRTIRVPTYTLELLAVRYRPRFTFTQGGDERINGRGTLRIQFIEQVRPTLIRSQQGADQRARGTVWVDPADGAVLKTMVMLGDDAPAEDFLRTTITVTYDYAPAVSLLVPVDMYENYTRRVQDDGSSYQLNAHAHFTNFRPFTVAARVLP